MARPVLANFKQRLKALEKHVAGTGCVLTESHVVVLERKREDDIACGEIETTHPMEESLKEGARRELENITGVSGEPFK